MSARFLVVAILALVFQTRSLFAADQTEYLKKVPSILPPSAGIASPAVNYDQVRMLMSVAFPAAGADIDSPDFYCVVHILQWGEDTSTVAGSRWYVYRGRGSAATAGGVWTAQRFRGTRIYGSDRLRVLYVHLNVPADAISVVPMTSLSDLAQGLLLSTRNLPLVQFGSMVVEKDYLAVTYQLDVTKKLPAPIQNLSDAIGLLQAAPAGAIALKQKIAIYAADTFDIAHVPSDITISGKLTFGPDIAKKTTDLGKQTYDNEGLYRWDVSLGIPLRSLKQLDFQTSGGEVFVKEVERSQLMAFLNIFVRPVDTKNVRFMNFPRPVVGIALSKKPLERIFVGGSVGLNKLQFFAGRQWAQVDTAPTPGSSATPEPQGAIKYEQDWMFGINVPVRQVVDFLKAKK